MPSFVSWHNTLDLLANVGVCQRVSLWKPITNKNGWGANLLPSTTDRGHDAHTAEEHIVITDTPT